jgi:hypothetical protein
MQEAMMEECLTSRLRPCRTTVGVELIDGHAGSGDSPISVPAGHLFSRARLRHLRASSRIVVADASRLLGLAAFKRFDSDVRVVHEFVLDRALTESDAATATDLLLVALEIVAYDDRVCWLTLLLEPDLAVAPFEQRGFTALAMRPSGTWLQKRLDRLEWVCRCSDAAH